MTKLCALQNSLSIFLEQTIKASTCYNFLLSLFLFKTIREVLVYLTKSIKDLGNQRPEITTLNVWLIYSISLYLFKYEKFDWIYCLGGSILENLYIVSYSTPTISHLFSKRWYFVWTFDNLNFSSLLIKWIQEQKNSYLSYF